MGSLKPLRKAALAAYDRAVRDVLGPGERRRRTDGLAVRWAHEIAWKEHGVGDEHAALARSAEIYGVPLDWVLNEVATELPAVVPARRRTDHLAEVVEVYPHQDIPRAATA